MIPKGRHRARAVNAALGLTQKGAEQVGVQFELLDEPGGMITWYGYFTEKTMENTVKSLRTCGWDGEDLSDLRNIDANEVTLVIEHEADDKGGTRAKVRWVNDAGGLAMKSQLAPDQAKAFGARMRSAVLAYGKPTPRPAAPPARHISHPDASPPVGADDDIPF